MKEPFWIISSKTFKAGRPSWSILKIIVVWILTQWFYFKSLYLEKCDNTKSHGFGHFLNGNGICLRCKKNITQLGIETSIMKKVIA